MGSRGMAPLAPLAFPVLVLQLLSVAHASRPMRGCPTYNTTANTTFGAPPLPLPYDGYLPAIDNETMFLHYVRHAGGAINTVNAVLARYPSLRSLPLAEIVQKVGLRTFTNQHKLLPNDTTALRNNAGSAYNHAIFWRIMTSYNSSSPSALGAELAAKINATWGSPVAMLDALRAAGGSLFGSGWAWVVYRPTDRSLRIVSTPNQDNPVMMQFANEASMGVPLIGVDVWEHAYYLKYRNVRASYLSMWVGLVNWAAMQANYEHAKAGRIDSLYC